jgi:hypothetical protein
VGEESNAAVAALKKQGFREPCFFAGKSIFFFLVSLQRPSHIPFSATLIA